jgi:hypothetical protein
LQRNANKKSDKVSLKLKKAILKNVTVKKGFIVKKSVLENNIQKHSYLV